MVAVSDLLQELLVEIKRHVGVAGWDQPPQLFALARTADRVVREPEFAAQLGLDPAVVPPDALTPVEQEPLPDGPLDESLAQVGWPREVEGCALVQEVVMLPPPPAFRCGTAALLASAAVPVWRL